MIGSPPAGASAMARRFVEDCQRLGLSPVDVQARCGTTGPDDTVNFCVSLYKLQAAGFDLGYIIAGTRTPWMTPSA